MVKGVIKCYKIRYVLYIIIRVDIIGAIIIIIIRIFVVIIYFYGIFKFLW